MSMKSSSSTNPGLFMGALLFCIWLLCWAVLMGVFRGSQIGGLPLITWSQIILGVLAVVVGVIAVPLLDKWERS